MKLLSLYYKIYKKIIKVTIYLLILYLVDGKSTILLSSLLGKELLFSAIQLVDQKLGIYFVFYIIK